MCEKKSNFHDLNQYPEDFPNTTIFAGFTNIWKNHAVELLREIRSILNAYQKPKNIRSLNKFLVPMREGVQLQVIAGKQELSDKLKSCFNNAGS